MTKVISIHEYSLKSSVNEIEFEKALRNTHIHGLLRLPGLETYYFVKGIRGERKGKYTAIWIYRSREMWEKLWGSLENPIKKVDYPKNWKVWEDEVLAPFLDCDPDQITFVSYQEIAK